MELDGRTAVITGGASGIGRALAERCHREGMSVVLADIEGEKNAAVAGAIDPTGERVLAVTCDVADPDQVDALKRQALDRFGAVHLLCNNAGVACGRPNIKTSPAMWKWVVDVNLLGVAYGVSAFAPAMVAQGEGHIVNTASEAGLTASPVLGSYHATKYAVVGLSESLAMELEGTGVGVTCVCPELVDTKVFEATRNAPPELGLPAPPPVDIRDVAKWMGTVPMDPADAAAQIVYAVRAGRFWVLTHDSTRARVRFRNDNLEAGRPPKMGR